MTRTERVIVGVSGTPGNLPALRYALDLARREDAMLVAAIAWIPPGGDYAERRTPSPELRKAWTKAAAGRLTEAMRLAWGSPDPGGLTVRTVVRRGEPGPMLLRIAGTDDVLVVGAGRRGRLRRVPGGRVSRYCIARAAGPVVAVPPASSSRRSWHRPGGLLFRHRQVTVDDALREWGRLPA